MLVAYLFHRRYYRRRMRITAEQQEQRRQRALEQANGQHHDATQLPSSPAWPVYQQQHMMIITSTSGNFSPANGDQPSQEAYYRSLPPLEAPRGGQPAVGTLKGSGSMNGSGEVAGANVNVQFLPPGDEEAATALYGRGMYLPSPPPSTNSALASPLIVKPGGEAASDGDSDVAVDVEVSTGKTEEEQKRDGE